MSKGFRYVSLDPLIHSASWVRKERERERFTAEAVEVYRRSTARHCPSCSCRKDEPVT